MLPKAHIIFGAIFSFIFLSFFPKIEWYYIIIFFLSSFLIDFDHYCIAVLKTKKISLSNALNYYKKMEKIELMEKNKGILRKGDFHIFHTIEAHLFVLMLGFAFPPFLYVFYGMLFHSILDLIDLIWRGRLYRREFILGNWIANIIVKKFKEN